MTSKPVSNPLTCVWCLSGLPLDENGKHISTPGPSALKLFCLKNYARPPKVERATEGNRETE